MNDLELRTEINASAAMISVMAVNRPYSLVEIESCGSFSIGSA
jgi:hypothetical protein